MKRNLQFSSYLLLSWILFSGIHADLWAGSSQNRPSKAYAVSKSNESGIGIGLKAGFKKKKIQSIWKKPQSPETEPHAQSGFVLGLLGIGMTGLAWLVSLTVSSAGALPGLILVFAGIFGLVALGLGISGLLRIMKNEKAGKRKAIFAILTPILEIGIIFGGLAILLRHGW